MRTEERPNPVAVPVVERLRKRSRTLWAGVFLGGVAAAFWLGSRYPALQRKATMTGPLDKANPLGFESLVGVSADQSFVWRVFGNTINWLYVNRTGMAFGIVAAAGILTLLSTLVHRHVRSRIGNTVLGAVAGMPLGLCANCAAPVATAMRTSGMRVESALAALIASPTLNVIVLTMVVSLFPPYMVVIKLAGTAIVLLLLVPVIAWAADRRGGVVAYDHACEVPVPDATFAAGALWTARALAGNLWLVVRRAVPLMVLAGFLGALVITVLPWDSLSDALPQFRGPMLLAALAGVAIFGVFLPVPMAFDVVLAGAFYAAGMPAPYVMVLLFTLGIFSVYPFTLLGRSISWRTAVAMGTSIAVIGTGTGAAALYVDAQQEHRLLDMLAVELERDGPLTRAGLAVPVAFRGTPAPPVEWTPVDVTTEGVSVERASLTPRSTRASGDPVFTRIEGPQLGFADRAPRGILDRYLLPFMELGGIASGDVDNDGWDDVLLATERGLELYMNRGGSFERAPVALPWDEPFQAAAAMLVDLDGDGWLDIVFSGFRRGVHVVWNEEGRFDTGRSELIYEGPSDMANAMAAGDLDGDGRVDLVLGNYTAGLAEFVFPESANVVLRNTPDGFETEDLPDVPGHTLTTLLSDLNDDGMLDLFVGNDFSEPDRFYLSHEGWWHPLGAEDGLVPYSTLTTMSMDSADITGDGRLELYVAQVSQPVREIPRAELCRRMPAGSGRQGCLDALPAAHAVLNRKAAPADCARLEGRERLECLVYGIFWQARTVNDPVRCEPLREVAPDVAHVCGYLGREPLRGRRYAGEIPSLQEGNVLLVQAEEGIVDLAPDAGVVDGGWSWNAKFADLDNDGWQDLYVANGWPGLPTAESAVLYRNRGGGVFSEETERFGLDLYEDANAYTFVDLDNDGDLDVIALRSDGPPVVFRNDSGGSTFQVELDAGDGNTSAIGAKVVVELDDGTRQLRELKMSGGYLSFDAPRLHFGLGHAGRVRAVEIRWPAGDVTRVDGPFDANARYRLTAG